MDINLAREVVTVLSFLAFVGIVIYAVHPGNRKRFDDAARAPLEEDPLPQPLDVRSCPRRGPPPGRGERS